MCYLSPAGQPFLLSPPCPALTPLVSAAAPSLDPCFLSELAGSWGVEVAAFQCCVFGLREMTVILQRLAGGGPVICGTQASNGEAKDKRRRSGCLSTMRACLHPGMMPLRVCICSNTDNYAITAQTVTQNTPVLKLTRIHKEIF